MNVVNYIVALWNSVTGFVSSTYWARSTAWIVLVTLVLILSVAFTTLLERKVIGWMQLRRGPNRVGSIFGFLPGIFQPFADVIKLLVKEVIVPRNASKLLFRFAPAITLVPAFAIWAVMPLSPDLVIADVDAGLLYVLSLTSVGVYGVILAGWASNSKYAFLGAMRSAAQIVAYEIAMGFALFFLAEYANMILISSLTAVFFFGGWLSPFDGYLPADNLLAKPSFAWLFAKLFFFLFCFLWFRATFPRYRYDQIMRLGWKILIPITLLWIFAEGAMAYWKFGPWRT